MNKNLAVALTLVLGLATALLYSIPPYPVAYAGNQTFGGVEFAPGGNMITPGGLTTGGSVSINAVQLNLLTPVNGEVLTYDLATNTVSLEPGGLGQNSWDASAGVAEAGDASFMTLDLVSHAHTLDADDTSAESILFRGVAADSYTGGTLALKLHYSMTSATSGTVQFGVEWQVDADGADVSAASFDTQQTFTAVTVPGTANTLDVITLVMTQAQSDAVAASDAFTIRVERIAASDTATGDSQIHKLVADWRP